MVTEIPGITVTVIRKRIKNIHLYVKPPDGRVEVTAPLRAVDSTIRAFVLEKADWIRRKQAEIAARPVPAEKQYLPGETLYVWGEPCILRLRTDARPVPPVYAGGEILLSVRPESTVKQREARVTEWYRDILREEIDRRLPLWSGTTGLFPASWHIRDMTSRWGSCNTRTGRICFNLQLAKRSPECLDYVILHELAHLRVPNHGPRFTAILDRYMPLWKEIRKKLNTPLPDMPDIQPGQCPDGE